MPANEEKLSNFTPARPESANSGAFENAILRSLPADELRLLQDRFDLVSLEVRAPLVQFDIEPEHVFFIERGLASIVAGAANGRGVEVAAIGRDGAIGVQLMSKQAIVEAFMQIRGSAIRVPRAHLLTVLGSCPRLTSKLARVTEMTLLVSAQGALCLLIHQVNARLARWLLTVRDLTSEPEYHITHEYIAQMLGATRPTVTLALRTLAQAGLIHHRRGQIAILDAEGLKDCACDCYQMLREEYGRNGM